MKSILDEAQEIIAGPRRGAYGPVEESFDRIALIWSGILGKPITGVQVSLLMVGLKVYRESNREGRDNRVDILGYTLLLDQLLEKKNDLGREKSRIPKIGRSRVSKKK